jgi:uncharacterized membrane protein
VKNGALLVVPAREKGRGGGHLVRSLELVRSLRDLGREAFLYLTAMEGADETAAAVSIVCKSVYDGTVAFALVNIIPATAYDTQENADMISYVKNSGGALTFTSFEPVAEGMQVAIDDLWINPADYNVEEVTASELERITRAGTAQAFAATVKKQDDVTANSTDTTQLNNGQAPLVASQEDARAGRDNKITVITVSENLMKELDKGNHTFAVVKADSSKFMPIPFKVIDRDSSVTGGSYWNYWPLIIILLIILLIICVILILKKVRSERLKRKTKKEVNDELDELLDEKFEEKFGESQTAFKYDFE